MTPRLFGTAGLRGVTNADITPELAVRLARAFGNWIRDRASRHGSAVVGHDPRWGAPMLARAAAAGFASAGFNVRHAGLATAGAFAANVARARQDGGLYVTGSHMPPDRIGLLLATADGAIAPFSLTDAVEALLAAPAPPVAPDRVGRIEDAPDASGLYLDTVIQAVDIPLVRSCSFRVLLDPANGAAGPVAGEFFRRLGVSVELIHAEPGPVPARPSEPRAHTVGEAVRRVRETSADLGACFDVDADRVLFIDHDGIPLSEDAAGALFARHELAAGDTCVVPVNSSALIEQVCRAAGARLEYCAIGQPATIQAIRDLGAVFSYEESGKYWFARRFLWSDALYSAARLLEIMARTGRSAAELAAGLPAFYQSRRNIPVEDGKKDLLMEAVAARLRSRLAEGRLHDLTLDGFKRVYRDGSWILFRKSGTEPLVRVYSDAPSRERADGLAAAGETLLKECL
jgi:phosphomannomutase/phosphoglucomutase